MEFRVLTQQEYRDFTATHPQTSFNQTVEMANMKREQGSVIHLVGVLDGGQVLAAAMLMEDPAYLGRKRFYSPRGLLVDYHNKTVLAFFVKELKAYIKKRGGMMLVIDPNVIYRTRTPEGDIIEGAPADDETVNNLKELGFSHHGFNVYLDAIQVRWCCRLPMDEDYEAKKAKFSKQTRKNINTCIKKGLMVREGKMEDLSVMADIFDDTARRRDFLVRGLDYYQLMYRHMSDLMTIYIAYLDPDVYLRHTAQLLSEAEETLRKTEEKMANQQTGEKVERMRQEAITQIEKYRCEMRRAEEFAQKYPSGKDVGCLLSLKSGEEYLTFLSGTLPEYRSFNPKYLLYEHHIKEAYKEGFKFCNFYGITGDFSPENKYFGVYEFKRGFKPNVAEYVGQFELGIGPLYKLIQSLKKLRK